MLASEGQGWLSATSLVRYEVAERRLALPDTRGRVAIEAKVAVEPAKTLMGR